MAPVVDWGRRDYVDALDAMRRAIADRRAAGREDTLFLVEHPPVITVGVEGDDGGAEQSGLPVVRVERGGQGFTMARVSWSVTRSWTSNAAGAT